MEEAPSYEVRRWLTAEQLRGVGYSDYWNDEDAEREKEWWTLDGDFAQMEGYVNEATTLGRQLSDALAVAPPDGAGADLAGGTLWAVPRLLAAGAEKVYAIEFSEHRLLRLGPHVLHHYGVPAERVVLCLGSFYALGLESGSLRFVLLSQALHHADAPDALLDEVRRVLVPDGVVYVIGEHVPPALGVLRRAAGGIGLRSSHLVDPVLGDHYYTFGEYDRMFRRAGLGVVDQRRYRDGIAFVLRAGSRGRARR